MIYPFHLWPSKNSATVSLSLSYLKAYAAFADLSVRQTLFDEAEIAVGQLSSKNLNGFPAFPLSRLGDPKIAERFQEFVGKLLNTGGFR